MRHNLTIVLVAILLLFLKRTCLGNSQLDDYYRARILNERENQRLDDEVKNANLNNARAAEDPDADMQEPGRNIPDEDEDTLAASGSENVHRSQSRGPSAVGVSVGNGWAVGQGRAYAAQGENARDEFGGRSGVRGNFNPGGESAGAGNVQYEEEYASKSGRDITIGRAGDTGRSREAATRRAAGYPDANSAADQGATRTAAGYPGIISAADQGATRAVAGYPGANSAVDQGRTRAEAGYPGTNSAVDQGRTRAVAGYPGTNSAADQGGAYDRGNGNGRTDVRLDNGNGRRGTETRYPAPDMTGIGIQKTVGKDGNVVYKYKTDGNPTRVVFKDKNGGVGVVDHFYETKNLNRGNLKGTSFRSGFSLAYGGGAGNSRSVSYGSSFGNGEGEVVLGSHPGNTGGVANGGGFGDQGAVAFGTGVGYGDAYGTGVGYGSAYGTGVGYGEPVVAYASGSGIASGRNINVGYASVGSVSGINPNNGAQSVGFSTRQGNFMGNGKGYIRG